MFFNLNLTIYQIKKLVEYCLDLSKSSLFASISLPLISSEKEILLSFKMIILSIIFLVFSLELSRSLLKETL